jgi:(p)ppGpp synthase/HD superfamily hydrolase
VTQADLAAAWFNGEVLDMVERLDGRPAGVSYHDNIVAMAAEGNIGVIIVKLADNLDNSDPARIAQLPPEQRSIERRYARARAVLEAAYNAFLEDA